MSSTRDKLQFLANLTILCLDCRLPRQLGTHNLKCMTSMTEGTQKPEPGKEQSELHFHNVVNTVSRTTPRGYDRVGGGICISLCTRLYAKRSPNWEPFLHP